MTFCPVSTSLHIVMCDDVNRNWNDSVSIWNIFDLSYDETWLEADSSSAIHYTALEETDRW